MARFHDLKVSTKLMALLVVLLTASLSVGAAALVGLGSVGAGAASIYSEGVVPLQQLSEARDANGSMRQRVLLHLVATEDDKPRRAQQIEEFDSQFDSSVEELRAALLG